jgi:hypothetical protein
VELWRDWGPYLDSRYEIVDAPGQRCIVQIMHFPQGGSDGSGEPGFIEDAEVIVDP